MADARPASAQTSTSYTWDSSTLTGTWDTTSAIWSVNGTSGPFDQMYGNGISDTVTFPSIPISGHYTISVESAINVNSITLLDAGGGTFSAGAGSLTLTGTSPTITGTQNTFSIAMAGSSGLTVNVTGSSLTFTGDNTYTGGTTLTGTGNLTLGNGGTTGSIIGDVAVNSGTLATNHSDDFTISGDISGAGTFRKGGSSTTETVYLTGTNTVSNVAIQRGILSIGNGGTTGSITGNVSANLFGGTLQFDRSDSYTYNGVVSGSNGKLKQEGTGTTTLTGAHTYTGATTVDHGTLLNDGSLSTSSAVTVNTGATFGGHGSAGAVTVNSGGTVLGGDGALASGSLSLTALTMQSGSSMKAVASSSGMSSVSVSGALTASPFTLNIGSDGSLVNGNNYSYTFLTYGSQSGLNTGTGAYTSSSPNGFNVAGVGFSISTWSIDVTGTAATVNFTPTPEPGTVLGISAAGLGLLGWVRRKRAAIAVS